MIVCKLIPFWAVNVYFITSRAEAEEYIRLNGTIEGEERAIERSVGCCYTLETKDGEKHRLMCVFDGSRNTAVHEAVHMARLILAHCGVRHNNSNDEPLAYMAGWLADEMLVLMEGERHGLGD